MSNNKGKSKNIISILKQNVGIDISKDSFYVSFSQLREDSSIRIAGSRNFKNTVKGMIKFINWTEKKRQSDLEIRFTMEATGIYYENLAYFLNDHDFYVSVILPNKAKAFSKSYNIKTKNDSVDAKLLGRMGLVPIAIGSNLEKWTPLSSNMRTLKKFCRERVMLLNEKQPFLIVYTLKRVLIYHIMILLNDLRIELSLLKSSLNPLKNKSRIYLKRIKY